MSGADSRVVAWFSAGAASAVATKLVLETSGDREVVVVYTNPGSEHPDNERFLDDCERWFGRSIVRLRSEKYRDTWDVWERERYLVGVDGARCTTELKRRPRFAFERPTDEQVFGYTAEEVGRVERFREQNPGVMLSTPLVDRGLTKSDCLAIIDRAGIELPAMYRLGYRNNNCVGCPKGGVGYWNKIRRDFPDVFDRMAKLERNIGHAILREYVDGDVPASDDCDDDEPVAVRVEEPSRRRRPAMARRTRPWARRRRERTRLRVLAPVRARRVGDRSVDANEPGP